MLGQAGRQGKGVKHASAELPGVPVRSYAEINPPDMRMTVSKRLMLEGLSKVRLAATQSRALQGGAGGQAAFWRVLPLSGGFCGLQVCVGGGRAADANREARMPGSSALCEGT